jgi:hypothetical protein
MRTNRKEKLTKSLALEFLVLCLLGCKLLTIPEVKPSPITKLSGDADLASLMESIRVQEGLPD